MTQLILKIQLLVLFVALTACTSTVEKTIRDTKYSAYELIGVQKRDLFKREVNGVKDGQEETSEAYKDALERLKEVYAFDGGNLEKEYTKLNSAYEDAQKESSDVSSSIKKLETVAQDLFAEWKKEIAEISALDLKTKSNKALQETQSKYKEFHASLKKSEKSMAPVLKKLKDQVLFLKHNLNAKAIAGLKTESAKIEGDISSLIKDMNTSISQAKKFIKTIE